jgi:hypothetical protein
MGTTGRRIRRTAAASAVTAGLLLATAAPALADEDGPTQGPITQGPITQGPITLGPEQATFVCTKRIPAILARVDRVTTRINADASTRGSTAWLHAREDTARAAGRTEVADRLQRRIDRRPERLDRLADAKKQPAPVG